MERWPLRRVIALVAAFVAAGCGGDGGGGGGGFGASQPPAPPPLAGSSGALVAAFGDEGVFLTDPTTEDDLPAAIVLQGSDLYVAGTQRTSGDTAWRIERRDSSDGAIEDFGTMVSNPGAGADYLRGLAVDAAFVYAVGSDSSGGAGQWRIEKRDRVTGTVDAAFGASGHVVSDPDPAGLDQAFAIAVDGLYMFVAGTDRNGGNYRWRIEKRLLADGAFDSGFGAGGVVLIDPTAGPGNERPVSVVLAGSDLYILGQDLGGGGRWRLEKRGASTGLPVASFGVSGVVLIDPTLGADGPQALVVDGSHLYTAGYQSSGTDFLWRVEKRSLADGSPDPAFGSSGFVTSNPGPGWDETKALAVDANSLYIAGFEEIAGNVGWRLEKRSVVDGSLDTAFGTAGAVSVNPTAAVEVALGVAFDSDGVFVVGIDETPGASLWRIEKRTK